MPLWLCVHSLQAVLASHWLFRVRWGGWRCPAKALMPGRQLRGRSGAFPPRGAQDPGSAVLCARAVFTLAVSAEKTDQAGPVPVRTGRPSPARVVTSVSDPSFPARSRTRTAEVCFCRAREVRGGEGDRGVLMARCPRSRVH